MLRAASLFELYVDPPNERPDTSGTRPSNEMKLVVDLKLEVDIPEEIYDCDGAMKDFVLREYKAETLAAMRFTGAEAERRCRPGGRHDITQKLRLLDTISQAPVVFGVLLDALLDLMNSEYGFIGEVKFEPDGTMYLQTKSTTNIAWNEATRAFYDENVANGLKFYNMNSLFGKCMTAKTVVISNDPKSDSRSCGIPSGHPPLNHFLGIPFFDHGCKNMVGMLAIANKPGGYTEEDVEFLEPFVDTCSNLIQAYNAIQENSRLINTLEEKVAERTNALSMANASLEAANLKIVAASAAQLTHFACMSHEIRTPLNCIVGLSSLLQETELTEKQRESLRMINTSGELLCTVVNDILDYSKLQSGNMVVEIRETNLQELLDSVVNSFEHKARSKQLGFKTLYAPSVPEVVETDSNRLQQILYNLLGNAVKFSEPGGSVELTVELLRDDNGPTERFASPESTPKVAVDPLSTDAPPSRCPFRRSPSNPAEESAASTDASINQSRCPFTRLDDSNHEPATSRVSHQLPTGTLRFTVKDYGRGIDKKDFARIFEPFGQASADTSRIYGGTGLGLAITSKLVERLGGKISVESELGKWSKFTVSLPMTLRFQPVAELAKNLANVDIMIVDKADDSSQRVFNELDQPVERFDTCEEMCERLTTRRLHETSQHRICLVDEDLYVPEFYRKVSSPSAILVTFGPKHKQISESRAHLRSISDRIPCVLVKSLVSLLQQQDQSKVVIRRSERVDIFNRVEVLIAEDNLVNQKVLCKMLQRLGVERIDIANNGKEAVDMSVEKHYDVIFMDMQMPVMCGDEACRCICANYEGKQRQPKIAFLSAHTSSSFVAKARAAGAEHFLSKPFNVKTFERFIRSLEL